MNYELENLIVDVFRRQENFALQRRPFNVKCKCHICGDSRKNPLQARLNSYYYKNDLMVNCYNCNYSSSALFYLRDFHPSEFQIFNEARKRERLRLFMMKNEVDSLDNINFQTVEDVIGNGSEEEKSLEENIKGGELNNSTIHLPRELPLCYSINDIVEEHPVVQYVINRKIPRDKWDRLFFTTEFQKLANMASPNTYLYERSEPRLVIPIYNKEGYIEAFQGRALRDGARDRYMTIKYFNEATKVYGLDTVDDSRMAFILEGQIDSLFIDNGLAITGGTISIDEIDRVYNGPRAFVLDNENRHPDTVKRIHDLIQKGENIVLFDKVDWQGKDINQFVINGIGIGAINEYLRNNVISGLEARLRFTTWSKVEGDIVRKERYNNYKQQEVSEALQHFFDMAKRKGA